jgi:DNA-binding CsgD family transcriptional regulator
MKCDGMTVREIAAALSISIGSVSSFTKQFGDHFNEQ